MSIADWLKGAPWAHMRGMIVERFECQGCGTLYVAAWERFPEPAPGRYLQLHRLRRRGA